MCGKNCNNNSVYALGGEIEVLTSASPRRLNPRRITWVWPLVVISCCL